MDHAIGLVVSAILLLCALVLEAVGVVDGFLATIMTRIGINPQAQIALLIAISVLLVVAAIRRLGLLLSALIIVLLVLLLLHQAMPGMSVPRINLPGGLPGAPAPGTVHA